MNSRLKHIRDWTALGKKANWSALAMAEYCGVSSRTLHRYFLKTTGKSIREWLAEHRQQQAREFLRGGLSVKETAVCLGYRYPSNFTRQYKNYWGSTPTAANGAHQAPPAAS